MSGMAAASNRRSAELRLLRERALPIAEGLVQAKRREVKIAEYQEKLAKADVDLLRDLIQFEDNRFLNRNFWSNAANVLRRTLRRHLEIAARVAWLAERALAYELDQPIDIVRFDYFPEKLQGITGADLLRTDLAELEALRIEAITRSVPVKHTISLMRDFPLTFGELKQTGHCTFRTTEEALRVTYPGTANFRIRAVSAVISHISVSPPIRGLLINQGLSVLHPQTDKEHVLVRPAEASPISEFSLRSDMGVYGLPDEALLAFEGSGIETFWEIHLPQPTNGEGHDSVVDVVITFDLWARFSAQQYAEALANAPKTTRRWILISGRHYDPRGFGDLVGAATEASIAFDVARTPLTSREKNRKLKNVAIFFTSMNALDVAATFGSSQPNNTVAVKFNASIAMSSIPATSTDPVPAPRPLNAFADVAADQRFTLYVSKDQNPLVDFSEVTDVVLAIEYEADLT